MAMSVGRQVLRALSVFSKIWFWFLVIAIVSIITIGEDLLDLHYTKRIWWSDFYNISSQFLVGGLVSFLFYYLVVYIPERKKRRIIKANLRQFYADTKQAIAYQIIFASQKGGRNDLSADTETVERLLTTSGFKTAFKGGREAHEGFYAFCNGISNNTPEYREIVLNLAMLSKQIDFVLHNYLIVDQRMFDFFKRLEIFLIRVESMGAGYDEEKILTRFIWEIFAGWDYVQGDRGYDIIEKMIGDI
jgi:hypothetical protein